jgi:Zn-dependent M28 family amino/carboxypeptidase
MRVLPRLFAFAAVVAAVPALSAQPVPADAAAVGRMKADLYFLAGPECEGRGVGTAGLDRAADYVAAAFKAAGLKTSFQPFTMNDYPELVGASTLTAAVGDARVAFDEKLDFAPTGYSSGGRLDAGVVFVGHGVTAPGLKYDDYAGVDVAGKWVIAVRSTPRPGETGDKRFDTTTPPGKDSPFAALALKFDTAVEKKAAGIIFVSDAVNAGDADPLISFDDHKNRTITARLPVVHLKRAAASKLLKAALGKTLAELEAENDRTLKPVSAELPNTRITADVGVRRAAIPVRNVVGVLDGSGPLADETVVVGAHYDHVGYGKGGHGAGGKAELGKLHAGADDNASGTTGLIELARRFGAMKDRRGRRLVFVAFTGEEWGLWGSKYYCDHPLYPLSKTAAMVNLDMIGRMRPAAGDWLGLTTKPKVIMYGTGTGDTFPRTVEAAEERYGLKIQKIAAGGGRSDHESFYLKKVPVLFLFTGLHEQYHRPSDTPDTIDVPAMTTVVSLTEDVVLDLSSALARPKYQVPTGVAAEDPLNPHAAATMPGGGVKLGVRPDYAYMGGDGMRLEGVTGGGLGSKAGLKDGDVIVEIAGVPVRSVEGYMAAMGGRRPGQPFEVIVVREGRRTPLRVTP